MSSRATLERKHHPSGVDGGPSGWLRNSTQPAKHVQHSARSSPGPLGPGQHVSCMGPPGHESAECRWGTELRSSHSPLCAQTGTQTRWSPPGCGRHRSPGGRPLPSRNSGRACRCTRWEERVRVTNADITVLRALIQETGGQMVGHRHGRNHRTNSRLFSFGGI